MRDEPLYDVKAEPMARICPYGDPYCPCQDGDTCHYEGVDPWTPSRSEDDHVQK